MKDVKIVVLDGDCANPGDLDWDAFRAIGEVEVFPHTSADEVIARAAGADVLLDNKVELTAGILGALPSVKYIGLLSTGYNVVDLAAADKLGVTVTNVPSYSTMSVAQHTFALLLSYAGRVGEHVDSVRRGDWSRCDNFCYWLREPIELCGKTMGIIGYGEIGRAVASIAHALGMNVLANRRSRGAAAQPFVRMAELPELLAKSDVVSLHCSLNGGNAHMVDAAFLAAMKRGAVLINTARGGLVDEDAVCDALESGALGAYLADVCEHEPPEEGRRIFGEKDAALTPHIAWASREARGRLLAEAALNLAAWLRGEARNVVNSPRKI